MLWASELETLNRRKQALLAESEATRAVCLLTVEQLRNNAAWVGNSWNVARQSRPWLWALPVAVYFLFRNRRSPWLANIGSGIRAARLVMALLGRR